VSELLDKCEQIARKAHEGQTRKFGEDKGKPYVIHPQRIANKMKHEALKCAAWLHDVVEDTDVKAEDLISEGIPKDIINAVCAVTKQKGESYFDFIMRIKKSGSLARMVKIGDLEDNMRNLKEGSLKDKYRLAKYILEEGLYDR
jgi:(p)ppGpp synthase/HD superfamily hydrolase